MWSYAQTANPITHEAGTIPPRPLQPGDSISWGQGALVEPVIAVSGTLLQTITPSGRTSIQFRDPIEGDDSRCIYAQVQENAHA